MNTKKSTDAATAASIASGAPTAPEKLSGGLPGADERLEDDEDALDEALAESFPASDPVSPGVAKHEHPSSGNK